MARSLEKLRRQIGPFGAQIERRPGVQIAQAAANPLLVFYDMATDLMKSAGIDFAAWGSHRIVNVSRS